MATKMVKIYWPESEGETAYGLVLVKDKDGVLYAEVDADRAKSELARNHGQTTFVKTKAEAKG